MFSVIYTFEVKESKQLQFEKAWQDMTELIYKFEGSLGSRLHKASESKYIAYAQWPDKETWKKSGDALPEEANEVRKRMRDSCVDISTTFELEMVSDLLRKEINKKTSS